MSGARKVDPFAAAFQAFNMNHRVFLDAERKAKEDKREKSVGSKGQPTPATTTSNGTPPTPT